MQAFAVVAQLSLVLRRAAGVGLSAALMSVLPSAGAADATTDVLKRYPTVNAGRLAFVAHSRIAGAVVRMSMSSSRTAARPDV